MRNNELAEGPPAAEPAEGPPAAESAEGPGVGPTPAPLPSPATPLLILATNDDEVCVDDLCLPADARS